MTKRKRLGILVGTRHLAVSKKYKKEGKHVVILKKGRGKLQGKKKSQSLYLMKLKAKEEELDLHLLVRRKKEGLEEWKNLKFNTTS